MQKKLTKFIPPLRIEKKLQTEVELILWTQVNQLRKKQKLKIKQLIEAMFRRYLKEEG